MEANKSYIVIPHAGPCELKIFIEQANRLRSEKWTYKKWEPTPALIEKVGGGSTQYIGQKFDPKYFDLDKTGWTHDHCEFCSKIISEYEINGDIVGYESNMDWLCKDCYNVIIKPTDIETGIKNLQVED